MAQKKTNDEEELTTEAYLLHLYSEVYFGIRSPQDAENLLRGHVKGLSASEEAEFRHLAREKGMRMVQCAEAFLTTLTVIGAGQ